MSRCLVWHDVNSKNGARVGRGNARSIIEGGACEGGLSASRPCFLWGAVAVDPKYLSDSVKTQLFEVRGVWWIIGKMAPVDATKCRKYLVALQTLRMLRRV